jgi:hypothetical protein
MAAAQLAISNLVCVCARRFYVIVHTSVIARTYRMAHSWARVVFACSQYSSRRWRARARCRRWHHRRRRRRRAPASRLRGRRTRAPRGCTLTARRQRRHRVRVAARQQRAHTRPPAMLMLALRYARFVVHAVSDACLGDQRGCTNVSERTRARAHTHVTHTALSTGMHLACVRTACACTVCYSACRCRVARFTTRNRCSRWILQL